MVRHSSPEPDAFKNRSGDVEVSKRFGGFLDGRNRIDSPIRSTGEIAAAACQMGGLRIMGFGKHYAQVVATLPKSWGFGVGAFAFEYKEQPERFTTAEWSDAVRAALEGLPTVSNLTISLEEPETVHESPPASSELISSDESLGINFTPDALGAVIEFELGIPHRLQRDIPGMRCSIGERFPVKVEYFYHGPVAFVACLDGGPDGVIGDGAQAVMVVREFIQDSLEKAPTAIKLTATGPSPFHAEFEVRPVESDGLFEWEEGHRAGYRLIRMGYSDLAGGQERAWRAFQHMLGNEFSVYYLLARMELRRMRHADLVAEQAALLIAASTASGFRGLVERVFRTSGRARDLGLLAIRARLIAESDARFAESEIPTLLLESNNMGVATTEMERTASLIHAEQLDSAMSVVEFLETSRSREFEVAVVAASTVLGGLAGAIVAVVAGIGS